MKKITSILLIGLIAAQTLMVGAVSSTGVDSYYTGIPTIDGETSRTVDYLYDGVTRTDFVLSTSSKYSNHGAPQRFSTLEFDPSQDDLYLEVTGGTYISSHVKTSTAITNYNSAHASEGKTAIAATNGDLWLMSTGSGKRIFTSGTNQNVTKAYEVPMGFAMYGGELVCTQDLSKTESDSFGIASDGTALIGRLSPNIKATNQTTGSVITVDGINRIPEDGYLVMYTDQGYSSNHSMNDAYEVIIDCDYDYTVKAGATITGKVTAITKPGGTKYDCIANRIVLTARGDDKIALLSDYSIGDTVSVKVDIIDHNGNTEKWYTVTDCVSGHFTHVINGVATEWPAGQKVNYPATVLGIKKDGNVIILTSYGRQIDSGYSEGLWIYEMPELLVEMGVVNAFMLDGGGSAAMVCENSSGSYELTGKTWDNKSDVLGTERSVINNIILAVGPSRSGVDVSNVAINNNTQNILVRNENNVVASQNNGTLSVTASDYKNPSFYFDLFGGASANTYKYMVIEGTPTVNTGGTFTLGLYPSAGRNLDPAISTGQKITFDCNGTWQRKLVDLSSLSTWTGRMNFIRMDLFDDTGIGLSGEGIDITKVRFFSTKSAATSFLNGTGEKVPGDASGDGTLSLYDVTVTLKKIAGWSITAQSQADYNGDGTLNLVDAMLALRDLAG